MSFFEDASLVLIPSAQKTSKVYSVKPTDGTGDLTFTRSNDTATRVGPDGLIEKVRTNVIPYSQAFDNALWSKDSNGTGVAPSVTANNATAPDGTLTADTIVFNAGAGTTTGDSSVIYQAITLTGLATASFYARVTSGTGQLVFRSVAGSTYTTANLTTTWQRFSAAENGSSGFFEIGIRRGLTNEPINASVTVEMWGAQLEAGDVATDYIATTSAAVSVGPVANVPRLDYLNSSCPRLLLEPQRTNINLYSEDLTNAFYFKNNCTIAANSVTSPDGFQNADTATFTSGGNFGYFYSFAGNSSVAFSFFVKKGNYTSLIVLEQFYFATSITFNLDAKTATGGGKVEDYGNGWLRCSWVQAYGAGQTVIAWQFSEAAGAAGFAYFYGFQAEAGAYATSYIPTLGAAVTRGADVASKTSATALIGQTEGTLFVEANVTSGYDANNLFITISDGSTSNMIFINRVGGKVEYYVGTGGAGQASFTAANVLSTGVHKLAVAYKANDFALYIDGVLAHSDTSGTVPACSNLNVGSFVFDNLPLNGGIKQALVFKTRLTNAQLAELTTL